MKNLLRFLFNNFKKLRIPQIIVGTINKYNMNTYIVISYMYMFPIWDIFLILIFLVGLS